MCIGEPVNERGHAGCLELRQGAQFLIQQVATEINAVKRKLLHCFGNFRVDGTTSHAAQLEAERDDAVMLGLSKESAPGI